MFELNAPIAMERLSRFGIAAALASACLAPLAACGDTRLVEPPVVVIAELQLSTEWPYVDVGQSDTLSVVATDRSGAPVPAVGVMWMSSDTTVAAVANGVVTGRRTGTATITARSGEKSDSVSITVEQPVGAGYPFLRASSEGLLAGDTIRLTVWPSNHSARLSSSDTTVLKVDPTGLVRTVARGMADVTVQMGTRTARLTLEVLRPYRVDFLGESTTPTALNELGDVVGYAGTVGFLWKNGTSKPLGGWRPLAVNDRGVIVGTSGNGGWLQTSTAVRWEGGVLSTLVTAPPSWTVEASGINSRGEVVGRTINYNYCNRRCEGVAWIYRDGNFVEITSGIFDPVRPSINEAGWVVGSGSLDHAYNSRSFLHRDGQTVWLAPANAQHVAIDINNDGRILGGPAIGVSSVATPLLWTGGGEPTRLGTTLNGLMTLNALNDQGTLVGGISWLPGSGLMIREGRSMLLDRLVADRNWRIYAAVGVNNRGQIIASARNDSTGQVGGVLLTPDP